MWIKSINITSCNWLNFGLVFLVIGGFEKDMFKRQNEKRATEREAYLWSVSDMWRNHYSRSKRSCTSPRVSYRRYNFICSYIFLSQTLVWYTGVSVSVPEITWDFSSNEWIIVLWIISGWSTCSSPGHSESFRRYLHDSLAMVPQRHLLNHLPFDMQNISDTLDGMGHLMSLWLILSYMIGSISGLCSKTQN